VRVALILGAGWSAAAGYPLARELLRGAVSVADEPALARVRATLDAFARFAAPAERFLDAVRAGKVLVPPGPDDEPTLFEGGAGLLPWTWAVETLVLKLLWPGGGTGGAELLQSRADLRKRRGGHLHEPANAAAHHAFAQALLAEHELIGIVTTNYDTLAEGVFTGTFHYGGLGPNQLALGANFWDYYNDPAPERRAIELSGPIPVCKLRGSINWEREHDTVAIWRDMRLPSRDPSRALIERLAPVWDAAADVLEAAERWIVVGYSAAPADSDVCALLEQAARSGALTAVELHDPAAHALQARWEQLTGARVEPRPGLESGPPREVNRLAFFYGIDVYMPRPPAAGEPPHVRARYGSRRASLSLPQLAVIDGALPDRALALVREWASAHEEALARNWTRAQANQEPEPVPPLE
jgi:hypothetical protein